MHGVPTERSFGLSVGGACVAVAALLTWTGSPGGAAALFVVGALLVILALVAPAALRVPNRLWWRLAELLGWVNSRIVLTLFFVLVLTPVGIAMRLFGRDPLKGPQPDTGWAPYPQRRTDTRHYEHLF
jgi:multisubunit Na+/H+ antiporter MnhB subunit